jgi:hypothetical protein
LPSLSASAAFTFVTAALSLMAANLSRGILI